jgi:beta-glucosidase
VPVYHGRKPTSYRSYVDLTREPLFPLGHGLSYTTFRIGTPKVAPATIGAGGEATVTVDVTNTGARAGDEVVQLYVRDRVASVTRPVQELRGFERVTLAPGETRTVTFKVGPAALQFTDEQMNRRVEPGMFDLMVGNSSRTAATAPLEVVAR